jgi:hypothetical protein
MDGADLGDRIGGQEAEELMLALDRARLGATRALPRRPDARKGVVRTAGALPPPLPSAEALRRSRWWNWILAWTRTMRTVRTVAPRRFLARNG